MGRASRVVNGFCRLESIWFYSSFGLWIGIDKANGLVLSRACLFLMFWEEVLALFLCLRVVGFFFLVVIFKFFLIRM